MNQDTLALVEHIIAISSIICAITPTPKEGSLLYFPYKLIEWLALITNKTKQKGEDNGLTYYRTENH